MNWLKRWCLSGLPAWSSCEEERRSSCLKQLSKGQQPMWTWTGKKLHVPGLIPAAALVPGGYTSLPGKGKVMQERANVFISATTADLGSYRLAVRDVLLDRGVYPILQDHLEPDHQTMMAILRQEIDACDAVICLVGFGYGQEPKNRPAGAPRRSYTQLEFEIAEAFGKPIYVFLTADQCPCDRRPDESPELRQLQLEYRERLRQRPHKREYFDALADLCRRIATIRFPEPGPAVGKPHNLPYLSLGTHFKGREPFLADLHQRLTATPGAAAAIIARQAIHGLGGVGKTRLAVEYAWRFQADYTALLFVFADTPANLHRNLAALTEPLRLEQQQVQEEEVRVAAVLRWLEDKNGWLLILDNVDTDDVAQAVGYLLPRLQRGHVLITSRLAQWYGVEPLPLDVLDEPDAVAFLLERTAGFRYATLQDEADALALARALGGLALALEQAGAYIQHLRCKLGEYLARWRSQEARVRTWFDARLMHYPRSVAVTWETTLAQLDEPARALLRLLAWLAPDPIPRALFRGTAADQIFATAVAGPGGNMTTSEVSLAEALAALAKYSMVKWTDVTNASVQVHRLVQEITRGRLAEEEQRFWCEQALRLVDAALPPEPPSHDVRSWPVWEPFQPHVAFVVDHADQAGLAEPTARLMNELGVFLTTKCMFAEAEPLCRRALAIDEVAYGLTHPTVAIALNNLAGLLWATNRLEEAEPLFRRALAIDEAAYGLTHSTVAIRLNNLAGLLWATNCLAEAEPLYRRALAIDEAAYGLTHPTVAIDLNNLAGLLRETNRLREAEPLIHRALAIGEATYGPTHPRVATALNNLAELLQKTNRLAEAEPLFRRALAIDEAAYGPTHPPVAIALNNLALLLQDTNRLAEAEPLFRRALAIDEAAYGPAHPMVARDLNNLAAMLQATNRLAEAEPLMRQSVSILKHFNDSTGHEHPHWQVALANYNGLLQAIGLSQEEIARRLQDIAGHPTSRSESSDTVRRL
jgi:tetratricopeptide (TPR) repeat protein